MQDKLKIWLQVARAYQKTGRRLSERLRELDLSGAQLDVLANLSRHPQGMNQTELGGKLLSTKANVTGLVERLVSRGLVQRQPDPNDARSKTVSLTPAGEELAARAGALHARFVDDMLAGLSGEDLARLQAIMTRVESELDRM
ncbi:MAG: MarR family winged helix-turn-helix transcriptional regulator [Vulcanimicrobiota bacterium]